NNIDDAAVRKPGNAYPHDVGKRRFIIQRGRKYRARFTEKMVVGAELQLGLAPPQGFFGALPFRDVHDGASTLKESSLHLMSRNRVDFHSHRISITIPRH